MKITLNPEHRLNQGEEYGDYSMEWHLEPESEWHQGQPTFRPDGELPRIKINGATRQVDCIFMENGIEHAIEDGRIIVVEPLRIKYSKMIHTL